ncbi:hypothetical protein JGS39_34665 [Streptomyces sp. P01-B04]|uniref:hypothetical protein n=1 Tax=Streptomyces poriferorum TaxID=2798799 RepID=UPI001C5DA32D|nr:hypothetical protein [Streptomyces poriferorum]MBW5254050.1 hypothetical protein [Streptomyces poriferorum]MBW5261956.1 hypothetical protein [Streptomyces poriferorum]
MPRTVAPARRHTARSRRLRLTAAFAVLVAVAGYMTVQYVTGGTSSDQCTVESADGSAGEGRTYRLTSEQAANAATISAVGTTRGMPERAVTIALATALQESGLRNIEHGDRDSLGLFQQRPSQGWGTEKQILDPVYSAGKFYEHLAEVPGYSRLPLTVAAQRVQRSGFPQAYAKHEPDAALLAAALTGRAPAALNCDPPRSTAGTGEAAKVRAALVGSFGKDVLPSEDAAAAETPAAGAAAGTGTLSVPVQTARRAGQDGIPQRGWELAHWAVAQSEALGIDEVAYAGKKWDSGSGWRTERKDSGTTAVRMRLAQ